MQSGELRHKRIYYVSPTARETLTNAALLICCYSVLELGDTPELAFARLGDLKV